MESLEGIERKLDAVRGSQDYLAVLNELAWEVRKSDVHRALGLARQAQDQAERRCENAGECDELVRSLRTQAYVHSLVGDYSSSITCAMRGLDLLDDQDCCERIDLLNSLGWSLGNCGDHAQAIHVLHEGIDLAQRLGDDRRLGRTLNSLGATYSLVHDHPRAVEALERSLALDRRLGERRAEAISLNNLALAYSDMGRLDDALLVAIQSYEIALADNMTLFSQAVLDTLGDICLQRGDYVEALRYLDGAVAASRSTQGKADLCTALLHRAQVFLALERLPEAEASAGEGLAISHSISSRQEHYQLHETLSRVMQAMGRPEEALRHYQTFHKAKEELFSREASERLRNLQTAYEVEAARKDAEIHQLRNVELEREIAERRRAEQELEEAVAQLQAALDEVKTLSGLVPICSSCKKIRSDEGYWESVESYIASRTNAQFTHGICPECAARLYGEFGFTDPSDGQNASPDSGHKPSRL